MVVHTESGSCYVFDLEANTVCRSSGLDGNVLRRDDVAVPLLRMPFPPQVGEPMAFFIDVRGDGVETLRTTTVVTRIEV